MLRAGYERRAWIDVRQAGAWTGFRTRARWCAGAFIDQILRLPIQVEDQAVQRTLRDVYALGRSTALTAYDAGHLELAIRLHLPLATTDRALGAAAREAGVAVLP